MTSVLTDGKGHDEQPLAWQVIRPAAIIARYSDLHGYQPRARIRDVEDQSIGAVPERTFAWKLSNP